MLLRSLDWLKQPMRQETKITGKELGWSVGLWTTILHSENPSKELFVIIKPNFIIESKQIRLLILVLKTHVHSGPKDSFAAQRLCMLLFMSGWPGIIFHSNIHNPDFTRTNLPHPHSWSVFAKRKFPLWILEKYLVWVLSGYRRDYFKKKIMQCNA